jgi:hypothetical protein
MLPLRHTITPLVQETQKARQTYGRFPLSSSLSLAFSRRKRYTLQDTVPTATPQITAKKGLQGKQIKPNKPNHHQPRL